MSKTKKITTSKQARLQVTEQLQHSLPGLIDVLGQKEFEKRIKKAAKLLAEGIKAPKKKKLKNKSVQKNKETGRAA